MQLSETILKNLPAESKAYRRPDGGGLFIDVRTTGKKFWRITYRDSDGKVQTKTVGQWPAVSLVAARAALAQLKLLKERGDEVAIADVTALTFGQLAREWFDAKRTAWSDGYACRVWARIEADAMGDLEHRAIHSITPADLLAVLRKMEDRGALDVSKRLRQQMEDMWSMAVVTGRATTNPAVGLTRAMRKSPRVQHRKALAGAQMPEFFRRLEDSDLEERTKLGLRLVLHTALRTNEVRGGRWSEIKGDVWTIPAERMKMHRPHTVPLTPQVRAILKRLREIETGDMILPVSENTLLFGIYRMGFYKKATVHGFRGTFSTIAHDSGLWESQWIEVQLSHLDQDKVRSAYNSATFLPQRKKLMRWWSDLLDTYEDEARLLS